MILTEVVDIAEVPDAQDGTCIPMIEMHIPHNRKQQAIEETFLMEKAPPPVPPSDGVQVSKAKGTSAGADACHTAGMSQTCKHPAVAPADRMQHSEPKDKETGTDGCDTAEMSETCKPPPTLQQSNHRNAAIDQTHSANAGHTSPSFKPPPPNVPPPPKMLAADKAQWTDPRKTEQQKCPEMELDTRTEHQRERNGQNSEAFLMEKAPPPVPASDRVHDSKAKGTRADTDNCHAAGMSPTCKPPPPTCKPPPPNVPKAHAAQYEEPKTNKEPPWEMGIGTRQKEQRKGKDFDKELSQTCNHPPPVFKPPPQNVLNAQAPQYEKPERTEEPKR